MEDTRLQLKNSHLDKLNVDHLYHLSIFSTKSELQQKFSDVRFVCIGGTSARMRQFAEYMQSVLDNHDELHDLAGHGHRYSMFKVGPVLSVSHGMGTPSCSILLHEILKLINYAECKNVVVIRIGTSGGIGVDGGTVIVSTGAVTDLLDENHSFHILGNVKKVPCTLDESLAEEITEAAKKQFPKIPLIKGKTMCASDFYEAQGRLDGAFCEFEENDKREFLLKLKDLGVRNIEMEASVFAAMCNRAGLSAAVVCVTLLNRLVTDQLTDDKEILLDWQDRPQKIIGAFIKKRLHLD